jgi:hypothetical protein
VIRDRDDYVRRPQKEDSMATKASLRRIVNHNGFTTTDGRDQAVFDNDSLVLGVRREDWEDMGEPRCLSVVVDTKLTTDDGLRRLWPPSSQP